MSTSGKQILNLGLRSLTLLSKFLFVFFLGRYLEPDELGLYGLVAATITYAMSLIGLDFYIFTTREILKHDKTKWGGLLKDQSAILLILYLIFFPLLSLLFFKEFLPWSVFVWFYLLLFLEHVNQEFTRFYVTISDQLVSSALLFFRGGLWSIIAIVFMIKDESLRNLEFTFFSWTIGGLLALSLSIVRLMQLNICGWEKKIDWNWIITGLKISIPFLIATIALRGVFTFDRYLIEAFSGLELVGAYVIFIGLCNSLISFLDAGVISFMYPDLISNWQKKAPKEFSRSVIKLFVQTFLMTFAFSIISLIVLKPLLNWINNPFYLEKMNLFFWILLGMAMNALSMAPHYVLYAQGKDRPIITSHILSLLIFSSSTWLFSYHSKELSVPLGLCCTFFIVFLLKMWAFFRMTPIEYRSFRN